MKSLPELTQLQVGDVANVSLRGAIGCAEVVRRIVDTIDVELAAAEPADADFLAPWRERYGRRVLSGDSIRRSKQIASLTQRLGLPPPDNVAR
jgi:hypothetical protein